MKHYGHYTDNRPTYQIPDVEHRDFLITPEELNEVKSNLYLTMNITAALVTLKGMDYDEVWVSEDKHPYLAHSRWYKVEWTKELTPVIFRYVPAWEQVIALFPTIPDDIYLISSYMHIGQHSGADYDGIVANSRLATEEEYASLKTELESYPYFYQLQICKKRTWKMRATAKFEYDRMMQG